MSFWWGAAPPEKQAEAAVHTKVDTPDEADSVQTTMEWPPREKHLSGSADFRMESLTLPRDNGIDTTTESSETEINQVDDEEEAGSELWFEKYINKGDLSNVITFLIMVGGLFLKLFAPHAASDYIFSFGLFGFAGGITNWLAIKMLFDEVPGLIGSGVIPRRFEEIRREVKNTIMKTFFDGGFIKTYITEQSGDMISKLGLEDKIVGFLRSGKGKQMIREKLEGSRQSELGLMLAMVNVDIGGELMLKKVTDELASMAGQVGPLVMSVVDPDNLPIDKLRDEVDKLMTAKLAELDADKVKELMEEVIRKHLGWLVVWGNVFGGCIGIVAHAAGY